MKKLILLFLLSNYSFAQLDKYFNIVAKNDNESASRQLIMVNDIFEMNKNKYYQNVAKGKYEASLSAEAVKWYMEVYKIDFNERKFEQMKQYLYYGTLDISEKISFKNPEELVNLFFNSMYFFTTEKFRKEYFDPTPFLTGKKFVTIRYQTFNDRTMAVAQGMGNNCKQQIVINPDIWMKLSPKKRMYLIFHELCHDIFNMRHGDGSDIMYPVLDKGEIYCDWDIIRDFISSLIQLVRRGELKYTNCN